MARARQEEDRRQIYASIREDIYLAAKARATELRVPLRQFLEMALEVVLAAGDQPAGLPETPASPWNDEYLDMQTRQPLGSPVQLTKEEAQKVVRASFGALAPTRPPSVLDGSGSRNAESET